MKFLLALTLLAFAIADPTKTIVENAIATPSLSTLVTVLTTKGYEPVLNALSSPGNFTVFAPNNDAFADAKVDPSQVALVTQILYYHVLGQQIHSKDLDTINFPTTLMKDPKYVTLNGDAQNLNVYKDNRGDVFIFWGVPFEKGFTAKVVLADVQCSNGVVHVIDRVIFFPQNVADIAKTNGLDTLLKAVEETGLATAITTTPYLTILAPDDRAFYRAGWEKLTKEQLTDVLKYHVVPGNPLGYTTNLKDGQTLTTLGGQTLEVQEIFGRIFFKDSTGKLSGVVAENVLSDNGVVHVIDRVLIPKL